MRNNLSLMVLCLGACAPAVVAAQEPEPIDQPFEPDGEPDESIPSELEPVPSELEERGPERLRPGRRIVVPAQARHEPGSATDEENPAGEELPEPPQEIFMHGFRLGYLYVNGIGTALDPRNDPDGQTYAERYDMRAPHLFMFGYEITWRMIGHDWLNVILTANLLIAGLEQSRFFPSCNFLIGFEAFRMAQQGIGVSLTPTLEEPAHMIIAAGFTPRIGSFYVPIHAFFVPDMDGHHKLGITLGISFF